MRSPSCASGTFGMAPSLRLESAPSPLVQRGRCCAKNTSNGSVVAAASAGTRGAEVGVSRTSRRSPRSRRPFSNPGGRRFSCGLHREHLLAFAQGQAPPRAEGAHAFRARHRPVTPRRAAWACAVGDGLARECFTHPPYTVSVPLHSDDPGVGHHAPPSVRARRLRSRWSRDRSVLVIGTAFDATATPLPLPLHPVA